MKKHLDLFLTFFWIGLTTFGGGYAMIAVLKTTLSDRKKWLEAEEILELTAIAESTPGPVAINAATYIGYQRAGILGATLATLGVVLPSVIIILLISLVLDAFLSNQYAAAALIGIKVSVAFLILKVGIEMVVKMKKNSFNMTLVTSTILVMMIIECYQINFSSVYLFLLAALTGIIVGRRHA